MAKSSLRGELEVEVEIKAPAAKFFEMLAGTPHHLTKVSPRSVIYTMESGEQLAVLSSGTTFMAKVAKERIEVVDPEKKVVKFRVLEGDLMEEFKSFVFTLQVTRKEGGNGSIVKWHFEYEMIDEKVTHPESLIPFFAEMVKEIDEHLMSDE